MSNSKTDKAIRKSRTTLIISGFGVIALSIWGVIKMDSYFIANRTEFIEAVKDGLDVSAFEGLTEVQVDHILMIAAFAVLALISLVIFIFHLYVGLHARAEGFGRTRSRFYLVVTAVMIMVYFSAMFDVNGAESTYNRDVGDRIMDFVIDLTATLALSETMFHSIRIRLLEQGTSEGIAGRHADEASPDDDGASAEVPHE